MIIGKKVRLLPTIEQENLLWKSAFAAKWAYNYALGRQIEHYRLHKQYLHESVIRKEITQLKKQEKYAWLREVSAQIPKQAVKDLDQALTRFRKKSNQQKLGYKKRALKRAKRDKTYQLEFKDLEYFPNFKSRRLFEPKFYNDNVALLVKEGKALLQVVGWIELAEPTLIPIRNQRTSTTQITNPRITFDGKYWYLSVGVEEPNKSTVELTDESVGVDVGITLLAYCSNGMKMKSINKTQTVRKLKKRLRRLQCQVSRKYEMNKQDDTFIKTNNIKKLELEIKLLHRRLTNIRQNHIHQETNRLVKTKPYRIVVEDLNVSGMMKNKHLAKALQEQKLYEFIRVLTYKAERVGIAVVKVDRWYPSSKTCSCCGHVKKDLKLKDRVFTCVSCGTQLDRDYNASVNLANYGLVSSP